MINYNIPFAGVYCSCCSQPKESNNYTLNMLPIAGVYQPLATGEGCEPCEGYFQVDGRYAHSQSTPKYY